MESRGAAYCLRLYAGLRGKSSNLADAVARRHVEEQQRVRVRQAAKLIADVELRFERQRQFPLRSLAVDFDDLMALGEIGHHLANGDGDAIVTQGE